MNFFKFILIFTVPFVLCSNVANAVILDKEDRSANTFKVTVYYVPVLKNGQVCWHQDNKQKIFEVDYLPNHKINIDATIGSANLKTRYYCFEAHYDAVWKGSSKVFALTPNCTITMTTPKDQDMAYSDCALY